MSNDKTNLADVQPGGRVRLEDQLPPLPKAGYVTGGDFGHEAHNAFTPEQMREYALAALSAQPSPGGQGDALLESLVARWRNHAEEIGVSDNLLCQKIANCTMRHAAELQAVLAARQPVGEPVDDYDSAFQEADSPPYLVDAAGIYALQSFLTVAEEFRRSAEPYIEAIDEGACGGEDEVSEAFDTQLARAKEAISRSSIYAAPTAQAVDLADFKALYRAYVRLLESGRDRIRDLGGACDPVDVMEANDVDLQAARRVIDSQAVGK